MSPKAENMVVIKMTEYEGEVPLEGWVAAHLEHRHTHMHKPGILADVTFQVASSTFDYISPGNQTSILSNFFLKPKTNNSLL